MTAIVSARTCELRHAKELTARSRARATEQHRVGIAVGIDLLDRDHDAVHAHLETLAAHGNALHQAIRSAAPDAADHAARMTDALDAAALPLLRHLDDEEDIVIPLMALKGEPHG